MGETRHRDADGPADELPADKAAQLMKLLEALGMSPLAGTPAPREHKFWHTQPVPRSSEEVLNVAQDGPIRAAGSAVPAEAHPLPADFEWVEVDVNDAGERAALYVLLSENYVEDLDSRFRFDYPPNFLEWYAAALPATADRV